MQVMGAHLNKMLAFLVTMAGFPAPKANIYTVWTSSCKVEVRVDFPEPYYGTKVFFRSTNELNSRCVSPNGELSRHNCVDDFVGAMAVVHFQISPIGVSSQQCHTLREFVRTIDQDPQLPDRAPFAQTIEVTDGIASDIQVFGFSQRQLNSMNRWRISSWRMFRQDLFLSNATDPFLTIHWKHTLQPIRLIDAIPGAATTLVDSSIRHQPRPSP
jgi:hypothetical protein